MEVSWKWVAVPLLVCFLTIQLTIHRQVATDENSASFNLKCSENLKAKIGETVILLCATVPRTRVTRVEWMANDTTEVHLYRKGKDDLTSQAQDYKGKTSVFDQELSNGNCSLKLTVMPSHTGTYHCSVKNGNEEAKCSLNLIVHEKKEQRNAARPKSSFDFERANLFSIAIACAVLLLLYAFLPRH